MWTALGVVIMSFLYPITVTVLTFEMNVVSFLQPLDRADTPAWVISSHQEILTLVS